MSAGVPVKVNLDGAVFIELERIAARNGTTIAARNGTTIGALLAEAGRRISGTTPPRKGRARRRDHDVIVVDEWVVACRMGVSVPVIASRYHCSASTVYNRLTERGVISS